MTREEEHKFFDAILQKIKSIHDSKFADNYKLIPEIIWVSNPQDKLKNVRDKNNHITQIFFPEIFPNDIKILGNKRDNPDLWEIKKVRFYDD